jgi:hypothetical protein
MFRRAVAAASRSAQTAAAAPTPRRFASIDVSTFRGRHLETMFSLSPSEMDGLLKIAAGLKATMRGPNARVYQPLVSQTDSLWAGEDECGGRRTARARVGRFLVSACRAARR